MRTSTLRGLALLLAANFLPQVVFAQISISFSPISAQSALLSVEEQNRLQFNMGSPSTLSSTLVQSVIPNTLLESEFINFTFPDVTGSLTASLTYVENNAQGNVWAGTFDDGKGNIHLITKDNVTIGQATITGEIYELVPLKENIGIWIHKSNEGSTNFCGLEIENPTGTGQGPTCLFSDCPAIVSILVLVPQVTLDTVIKKYGPWTPIYFASLQVVVNLTLFNSGLPTKSVRLMFDFSFPFTFIGTTLGDMAQLTAVGSPASLKRVQYGADLVILLAPITFVTPNQTTALGVTNGINSAAPPNNEKAFAIVNAQKAIDYVFAHEVGHLLGGYHNKQVVVIDLQPVENCGLETGFGSAYAYYMYDPSLFNWSYLTAVGSFYQGGICDDVPIPTYIPYFSNPNIFYNNLPTGLDNQCCNASKLSYAMCPISNFVVTPELDFQIAGTPNCGNVFYADITQPPIGSYGQPPYRYQWAWSKNGAFSANNPGKNIGTTSSIPVFVICPEYYLRLTITSSDGVILTKIRHITPTNCTPCPKFSPSIDRSNTSTNQPEVDFELFPNPVSNNLMVQFSDLVSGNAVYSIHHLDGRLAMTFSRTYDETISDKIDVCELQSGLYQISILTASGNFSSHFLKI